MKMVKKKKRRRTTRIILLQKFYYSYKPLVAAIEELMISINFVAVSFAPLSVAWRLVYCSTVCAKNTISMASLKIFLSRVKLRRLLMLSTSVVLLAEMFVDANCSSIFVVSETKGQSDVSSSCQKPSLAQVCFATRIAGNGDEANLPENLASLWCVGNIPAQSNSTVTPATVLGHTYDPRLLLVTENYNSTSITF